MNKRQTIHTIIDKRYKILRKIGAGATGIVYRVEDLKSNKIIALKILSKQKTSSEAVQRFKREFQLLTQLHHPNLCSVYDFGMLKNGRSYFTMEYVDGRDIFKASKGLSHEKIYAWIVQLCRVLEYIHAKGLIHYDIKPGNVLIAKGKDFGAERENCSVVKLMDFGLAGEQRIKGGALIRGTFPYIAPEVIEGMAVDHRADLYSLGVLLYKIFTRKPFQEERESFVTLLNQCRQRETRLLSKVLARLPERIQRLFLHLLALEPAERFSRANEVIKEINKFSHSKFKLETEKTIEGYLLSSRFVGREKEMAFLRSSYERASNGKGNMVLVIGDAGIGKSRLLKEFRIFTQLQRSHSFTGYVHQKKTGPLEPFYDIFKELINYITDSTVSKISLAVLLKLFPDLADGRLRRSLPKLVPLGPQQEKLRTFEALATLIKYCTEELGELVILLEDLHWADDLTIQFLEYLGRNLDGKKILICGTARKEELVQNIVSQKAIANLRNEGYLRQIELRPLNYKYLYSFLDSTITPKSNSPELVQYLLEKTNGNPFFVEEIIRTLLQKRGAYIGEKFEICNFRKLTIPKKIEDVALSRVIVLEHNSQSIVKYAAILLKGFNYDMMKRLTDLDDTKLSRALWELRKRQILIEDANQYSFYHSTLREAVLNRLAARKKMGLYYHVGKTIEIINKKNLERVVEDLAHYFINAQDPVKGVAYGLRAAKRSSHRYANELAILFYNGVLSLSPNKNHKFRFDILQKLAHIEFVVGSYDTAIRYYKKALHLNTSTIDKIIKVYRYIGAVYDNRAEHAKALRIYKKMLRLLKKIKHYKLKSLLEANMIAKINRLYLMMGEYNKATQFNFDTLRFPKAFKEKEARRWLGSTYYIIGTIESHKGEYCKADYNKAIFYYKEAYKCFKKAKDEQSLATVLDNLGSNYFLNYNTKKAYDYYRKALQMSKKIGDQHGVSVRLCNLGQILSTEGYNFKALESFQEAFIIAKRLGNHFIIGAALSGLGDCYLKLCDYKKAKDYFESALEIFTTIGWKDRKIIAITYIGNVCQVMGDYDVAIKLYKHALRISKGIKNQQYVASLLISIGSASIELSDLFKTRKYLEDAQKITAALELKRVEIQADIFWCRLSIIMKDYITAYRCYTKGLKMVRKIRMKNEELKLRLLCSEIYYQEGKYLHGIKISNQAIKLAKAMGVKDLYSEALLSKIKHGIKQSTLSKQEAIEILDEAKMIAEEIGKPEVLWKIYFEYGNILQSNHEYRKALDYYQNCIEIFMAVSSKIKNKSYRKSYLNRPDRRAVFAAVDIVEKSI